MVWLPHEIDFDECHCLTHDNLGNPISNNNSEEHNNYETITITPLLILEQNEIKKALQLYNGNITKSATSLGISRNALYNKIKRYNIKI